MPHLLQRRETSLQREGHAAPFTPLIRLSCHHRRPRFSNHRDADFAGIAQVILNSIGDLPRERQRLALTDLVIVHHDSDLSASLNRKRLLDTLKRPADLLHVLEAPQGNVRGRPARSRASL